MTPDQRAVYDLKKTGLTLQQCADALGISRKAAARRWERAKAWDDADPIATRLASIDGATVIPRAAWIKMEGQSTFYTFDKPAQETETLLDAMADAFKDIPAYRPNPIAPTNDKLLTVYPLMDAHFGMFAWSKETGSQDYDLKLAASDLSTALHALWARAPKTDKAIFILGGDTLHADDNRAETPASGHKLDTDGRHYKAVAETIAAICHTIDGMCERHSQVIVRVLRGNHDPHSHLALHFALSARYRLTAQVKIEGAERDLYWYRHGNALIAAHHGDRAPAQRLCMTLADTCPEWSLARDRHVLTGHIHHDSIKDFPGVKWWSLRAFCPPDEYGSTFGSRRALQAMTFCAKDGFIGQTVTPINRGK